LGYTRILVSNSAEDSLSLTDLKEKAVVQKIFLPLEENKKLGPSDIITDEEKFLYIVNSHDDSIMKFDLLNLTTSSLIKVGRYPICIRIFKEKIYVVNCDSNSISVIDEKSFCLIEDISVGEKPTDIQIDKENLKIFISNENSHSISIIDLNKETVSSIILEMQPIKMIIDRERLFVLSYINNGRINYSNISEIDIKNYNIIMSLDLKGIFESFIKIKDKEEFYMSNAEDGYLYNIRIKNKVDISKIYLSGMPGNIISDGEDKLYIVNTSNNYISVVDIEKNLLINKIRVGKEPCGILLL
jgi:YVTN family beta-propeller protein